MGITPENVHLHPDKLRWRRWRGGGGGETPNTQPIADASAGEPYTGM